MDVHYLDYTRRLIYVNYTVMTKPIYEYFIRDYNDYIVSRI